MIPPAESRRLSTVRFDRAELASAGGFLPQIPVRRYDEKDSDKNKDHFNGGDKGMNAVLSTFRSWRWLGVIGSAWLAAGCAGQDQDGLLTAGAAAVQYRQLAGWSDDRVAAAVPAFVKSCARFTQQPDTAPLDANARGGAGFGTVGDWRPLCRQAAALPHGDERAARAFFETNFLPVAASANANGDGLVTGYYEVELHGSRRRQGRFQTPVYRRPPDLVAGKPYLDRSAIEDGALAGRGLELLWLAEPDDLLVLQTQGSGRVRLTDGSVVRLVYDANNTRGFVAVENLLLQRGTIPSNRFSNETVRAWMRQHKEAAKAIRRENPAYVFFAERQGDGPVGAQGAVLTPERSLAVDRHYVPLGMPLWLEAQDRYRPVTLRRLVVAQDVGDTIQGPGRGDFYWGSGPAAQSRGGDFYASGRFYLLLPRKLAHMLLASR